jgi:hypothetical protein
MRTTELKTQSEEFVGRVLVFWGGKLSVRFWTQSDHKLDPNSEFWSLTWNLLHASKSSSVLQLNRSTLCGFFFSESYFMLRSWSSSSVITSGLSLLFWENAELPLTCHQSEKLHALFGVATFSSDARFGWSRAEEGRWSKSPARQQLLLKC